MYDYTVGRIFLEDKVRENYFSSLKKSSKLSWTELAKKLAISDRQLRDLREGKYSLSTDIADRMRILFRIFLPKDAVVKNDHWYLEENAQKGGLNRFKLHGSPGTAIGRRKGGLNSIKTHIAKNTGFSTLKDIFLPPDSTDLAEIIGAFIGDGSLSKWQGKIYLNLKTDMFYAKYLQRALQGLFEIPVSIYQRTYTSTVDVVVSSKRFVEFLNKKGLPTGNKLKQGLDIPSWIYKNKDWQRACLRGLLDTDGCTYIDHHLYKNKQYVHIGIVYTSYSIYLLKSIGKILTNLGYSPTFASKNRIFLRKKDEVLRFFREFKPNNQRHVLKLQQFLEEYQSGRNGTASKAVVAVKVTVGSNPTSSARF